MASPMVAAGSALGLTSQPRNPSWREDRRAQFSAGPVVASTNGGIIKRRQPLPVPTFCCTPAHSHTPDSRLILRCRESPAIRDGVSLAAATIWAPRVRLRNLGA